MATLARAIAPDRLKASSTRRVPSLLVLCVLVAPLLQIWLPGVASAVGECDRIEKVEALRMDLYEVTEGIEKLSDEYLFRMETLSLLEKIHAGAKGLYLIAKVIMAGMASDRLPKECRALLLPDFEKMDARLDALIARAPKRPPAPPAGPTPPECVPSVKPLQEEIEKVIAERNRSIQMLETGVSPLYSKAAEVPIMTRLTWITHAASYVPKDCRKYVLPDIERMHAFMDEAAKRSRERNKGKWTACF